MNARWDYARRFEGRPEIPSPKLAAIPSTNLRAHYLWWAELTYQTAKALEVRGLVVEAATARAQTKSFIRRAKRTTT